MTTFGITAYRIATTLLSPAVPVLPVESALQVPPVLPC